MSRDAQPIPRPWILELVPLLVVILIAAHVFALVYWIYRWMGGFTLRNRMRNEYIHEKVGVAPVADTIRESRLRWFGHIKHRPFNDHIRRVDVLDPAYVKKGRGRPKKT